MNDADLATRLAELEKRVAALEDRPDLPPKQEDAFWAVNRLQQDYPDGAVIFAGHVHLPTGEHWRWKEMAHSSDLLGADWEGAAPAFAALGHPIRLSILRAVLHGKRTTAELQADSTLAAGGKLYHHLRDLQAGGWLAVQGRGRYTVPAGRVVPLLVMMQASGGLEKTGGNNDQKSLT